MSTKEVLIAARTIISDEKNWTQGAYARDKTGDPVEPDSLCAVCFCSIGAVRRALTLELNASQLRKDVLNVLSLELKGHPYIHQFNDNSTHQEVLALFDKAIANCQ